MIFSGANPIKYDLRDFKLSKIQPLGGFDISAIPDFSFASKVRDQGSTDLCTAYTVVNVAEKHEGVSLSPEYQFAKTKQILGDYIPWGADLRSAIKSALKFGCLETQFVSDDLSLEFSGRDTIANWKNWPGALDIEAKDHKQKSFFDIDEGFEATILAMWHNQDMTLTGAKWRSEWTNSKGVIPFRYGNYGSGHAFNFTGKKTIGGNIYLEAQSSTGVGVGANGLFYFSKDVFEKEIGKYGNFIMIDYPAEKYKKEHWSFLTKILNFIKRFLKI